MELIVLDRQRVSPFLESLIVLVAISKALVRLATNHARTALLVLPAVTAPTNTLQVLQQVVQMVPILVMHIARIRPPATIAAASRNHFPSVIVRSGPPNFWRMPLVEC